MVEQLKDVKIDDASTAYSKVGGSGQPMTDSVVRLQECEDVKAHLDSLMQSKLKRDRPCFADV